MQTKKKIKTLALLLLITGLVLGITRLVITLILIDSTGPLYVSFFNMLSYVGFLGNIWTIVICSIFLSAVHKYTESKNKGVLNTIAWLIISYCIIDLLFWMHFVFKINIYEWTDSSKTQYNIYQLIVTWNFITKILSVFASIGLVFIYFYVNKTFLIGHRTTQKKLKQIKEEVVSHDDFKSTTDAQLVKQNDDWNKGTIVGKATPKSKFEK